MPIRLKDKIKPDKDGLFPIVDSEDIAHKDGRLVDAIPQAMTEEEYYIKKAAGQIKESTPYLIYVEGGIK